MQNSIAYPEIFYYAITIEFMLKNQFESLISSMHRNFIQLGDKAGANVMLKQQMFFKD